MYLFVYSTELFGISLWARNGGQEGQISPPGKVVVVEREIKPVTSVQGGGYCSEGQG